MHIDFQQRVLQGFTELPRMALNNTVIIDVTNCAIEQTQQKIIDLLQ
jgi:thymidylate kinase